MRRPVCLCCSLLPWSAVILLSAPLSGQEDLIGDVRQPGLREPNQAQKIGTLERKLRERVDLVVEQESLRPLLRRLANERGIVIRFDEAAIRKAGISLDIETGVDVRNYTLQALLTQILRKYGLRATVDAGEIVVVPSPPQPVVTPADPPKLRVAAAPAVRAAPVRAVQVRAAGQIFYEVEAAEPAPTPRIADDDDLVNDAPADPPRRRLIVSAATFDRWLFGQNQKADLNRRQIDLLRKKIDAIDRVCQLTEVQKEKLELAGRGDCHRFFERADELRQRFEQVRKDPDQVLALSREVQPLRSLLETGPFGEGSLFAKLLKTNLTPGQSEKYQQHFPERPTISPSRKGF
ncbi:MAG TPA: hypothetical protein VL475_16350 [Planctomycetaceae bacterium]|nr:hypothetical protein [Planctomycetaceae bacterium]